MDLKIFTFALRVIYSRYKWCAKYEAGFKVEGTKE
jgi:hypothetical protein